MMILVHIDWIDWNQTCDSLMSFLLFQLDPVSQCLFSFQFHEYTVWPGHESGEEGRTGRGNREVFRKSRISEPKARRGKEFSERVYSTLDQCHFLAKNICFFCLVSAPSQLPQSYTRLRFLLYDPIHSSRGTEVKVGLAWCMMTSK